MILLLPILLLALSIGAGDTSSSISTLVGSRILTLRRALLLSILFLVLGLLLEGWKVKETVAKGLITGEREFLKCVPEAVIPICLATFVCSFPFLILGFPVSTTQTLLASLIGAGLIMGRGLAFRVERFGTLLMCWMISPLMSMLLAFLLALLLPRVLRSIRSLLVFNQILTALLLFSSAYVAYTNGANDGGALLGIASSLGSSLLFTLCLGMTIVAGSVLLSRRVVMTVGLGITRLDPITAFLAQFAAALSVWSFVQLGFPVSLTQALVGSVMGVGLSRGRASTNVSKMKKILAIWILSPSLSLGLSMLLALPFSL
jgi:PiT family inorganic phosphate transporter